MSAERHSHPYWYKVAASKPKLHDHAEIFRQVIRDQLWYVIHDQISARQYRFTPESYRFIGLMDGRRTVQQALEMCKEQLGETAPGEDDVIRLLMQLHGLGALVVPTEQTGTTLFDQNREMKQKKIRQQMMSPLAVRIPLFDPADFLKKLEPLGRFLFSKFGLLVWCLTIVYGLIQTGIHFDELSNNFSDRVLAGNNLIVLTLVFVIVKLCHEFGHGLAVKRWHGEAHEMGIMFLVFFPVPYVDASAANVFKTKWQRMTVAAAGMYVEMFLAAIAISLWTLFEPGLLRSAFYNAALIGSVSTLLFNINPLLRFDGYYMLGDLLEIPNLGSRSQKYFIYLLQSKVMLLPDATTPEQDTRVKNWLLVYAILVAFYRVFIVSVIALFVSQKFFFLGVAIAFWAFAQLLIFPLYKSLKFLMFSSRLHSRRTGSIARLCGVLGILVSLVFLLPAPLTTYADGVIWVPEDAEMIVQSDGFVLNVGVAEGATVTAGTTLLTLKNTEIDVEKSSLLARIKALRARYKAEFVTDRIEAQLTKVEIGYATERLANLDVQLDGLILKANVDGIFALPVAADLEGQYVRRGELLGFIIDRRKVTVRVLVNQDDADLVQNHLTGTFVIMTDMLGDILKAEIIRVVPSATDQLPSMALSTFGGGSITVQRDEETGELKALQKGFEMELRFLEPPKEARVGQRVHVIFKHGLEAFGFQAIRRLRQLFLRELNV